MFAVFDQPYTLLIVAIIAAVIARMIPASNPEKAGLWKWGIPVLVAAFAFGLDILVKTDMEKIKAVIYQGIKATEQEDSISFDEIISDNYGDSFHNNKDTFMSYWKTILSKPLIEKNKKIGLKIEKSSQKATATLVVWTKFDERSGLCKYKKVMLTKFRIGLQEENNEWLVNSGEILEIDKSPVNWKNIRQFRW